MQYTCPKCGAGGAGNGVYFCHVCPTYEIMLPSDNGVIRKQYLRLGELKSTGKAKCAMDTDIGAKVQPMTKEELINSISNLYKSNAGMIAIEEVLNTFFELNVCIPKGENRHPNADVYHLAIEGKPCQTRYGNETWRDVKLTTDLEWRIKPSEPVYEWQWYYIENGEGVNAGWKTYDEVALLHDDPSNEKHYYVMPEIKRERVL